MSDVKLFLMLDDPCGHEVGFYVKGNPSREEIIEEIRLEYPGFWDDNFEILDSIKMTPCYVRMVPANKYDDSGFSCYYHECDKGRGAMKAIRFVVWETEDTDNG